MVPGTGTRYQVPPGTSMYHNNGWGASFYRGLIFIPTNTNELLYHSRARQGREQQQEEGKDEPKAMKKK
jgi:hypothetical protein